jgi:hypothetical protein
MKDHTATSDASLAGAFFEAAAATRDWMRRAKKKRKTKLTISTERTEMNARAFVIFEGFERRKLGNYLTIDWGMGCDCSGQWKRENRRESDLHFISRMEMFWRCGGGGVVVSWMVGGMRYGYGVGIANNRGCVCG